MKKIAVIGAGSFGTTLAVLLGEKGYNINLWVREKELLKKINSLKENTQYLKGIKIPKNVISKNSITDVVEKADIIVNAVPSQFTRGVTKIYAKSVNKNSIVINVAKGIEIHTCKTMSQVLKDELGKDVDIVTLSGPNHAEEISRKMPTATVVASENTDCLEKVKEIFQTDYFKVFTHDDIITLGLMEMSLFGRKLGAKRETFYGLAGVGDLVATCTSKHSRNRFVGEKIAQGKSIEEIEKEMHGMVAEGIKTTKAVYEFAKNHNMDLPLTKQAYYVLYKNKDIKLSITDLLNTFK